MKVAVSLALTTRGEIVFSAWGVHLGKKIEPASAAVSATRWLSDSKRSVTLRGAALARGSWSLKMVIIAAEFCTVVPTETEPPQAVSSDLWVLPSLQDERDTYTNWGGAVGARTWSGSAEPNMPSMSQGYDVVSIDVHDDSEGDPLWNEYWMWRRTGQNGWLQRAQQWEEYFRLFYRTEFLAQDTSFSYDHTYGPGMVQWFLTQGGQATLNEAKAIGDIIYDFHATFEGGWVTANFPVTIPSSARGAARQLMLATALAAADSNPKWVELRDYLIGRWQNGGYANYPTNTDPVYDSARGMYWETVALTDATFGANAYANGYRTIPSWYAALICEALFFAWRQTQATWIPTRLVAMANRILTFGVDATSQYPGAYMAYHPDGSPIHYDTNTGSYAGLYVNALIMGYRFSGNAALLDHAKFLFIRGTNSDDSGPGLRLAADNVVHHFLDTTLFEGVNGDLWCSRHHGELQYKYQLFENGGVPSQLLTVESLSIASHQRWDPNQPRAAPSAPWPWSFATTINASSTQAAQTELPVREYSDAILGSDGYFYYRGGAHVSGGGAYVASEVDRWPVSAMVAKLSSAAVQVEQRDHPRAPSWPDDGFSGAGSGNIFWYPGYPSANEPASALAGEYAGSGVYGPPNPTNSTEWVPACRHGYAMQGFIPSLGYVEFGFGATGKAGNTFTTGIGMNVYDPETKQWQLITQVLSGQLSAPALTSEWDDTNNCLLMLGNSTTNDTHFNELLVSEWTQALGWRTVPKSTGSWSWICTGSGSYGAAYYMGGGRHLVWATDPANPIGSTWSSWTGSRLNIYHHQPDGTGTVTAVSLAGFPHPGDGVRTTPIAVDRAKRIVWMLSAGAGDPETTNLTASLWRWTYSHSFAPNNDLTQVTISGTLHFPHGIGHCGARGMWYHGGYLLIAQSPVSSPTSLTFKRIRVN